MSSFIVPNPFMPFPKSKKNVNGETIDQNCYEKKVHTYFTSNTFKQKIRTKYKINLF